MEDTSKHRSIAAVPRPLKRDQEVARNLLNKYVDEVLTRKPKIDYTDVEVEENSFDAQLQALEEKNVPLISQTARKKAIWPVHASEQRRRCIDICKRVKRNEGTMISCRLSSELMDDELVIRLCSSLRENTCLEKLMLHDNSITDKAILPLCRAIRVHPSLNSLWLGANQLSDQSAEYLSALVEKNNVIKDLNLSNKWPVARWLDTEKLDHPHISEIGAIKFASALANCCGLTSLSLHDQRVRDRGAVALFEAIPHSSLVLLNVGKNEITDDACAAISSCLAAYCCPLREIFLDHNNIGNNGAVLISHGLSNNIGLFTLDLTANNIAEQGIEALYETLCINETMEAVMVRHNKYPGEVIESLMTERKQEREKALQEMSDKYAPASRQSRSRSSAASPLRTLSKWRKARDPKQMEKIIQNNRRFNHIRPDYSGRLLSPSSWSRYRGESPGNEVAGQDSASEGMFPSPNRTASGRQGLLVTPLRANVNSASSDENGLPGLTDTSHSRQGSASILSPMLSSPSKPRDTSPGSVDSRESIASAQALIISRGKSRENLTAGGDPSKQNRMDRILSANKADATRTKDEIGKTLGVPNLKGLIGRAPIRSAISRHGDSGTNLIHLRVTTPADPPDSAAISLLKIDIDRQKEREKVTRERQTEEYKEEKYLTMFYGNKGKLLANSKPTPPDKFWKEWKAKVQVMHPKGIDISAEERRTKLRKEKEREERLEHELSGAEHEHAGSDQNSPYNKNILKQSSYDKQNSSMAQKSMLELLAVEHVFRNNKNVDVGYLRNRAIAPIKEHLQPVLKKGSGSPKEKSSVTSAKSSVNNTTSISYPAMVGLPGEHHDVGGSLIDKRKLTCYT